MLEEELVHAPYKLLAIALDDRSKLEALRSAFEASAYAAEITCEFSCARYLEFYNRQAGKGNALRNLCSALHVHIKNTVAAGDEENDISMLRTAAVGVCMANGTPAVKAAADYVTARDNDHDGIAEVIERFVLKG